MIMYSESLEAINRHIIELSNIALSLVRKSVEILKPNQSAALKIIPEFKPIEVRADQKRDIICESCLQHIALYQPGPMELRRIMQIYKMAGDLEHICDLAYRVIKHSASFDQDPLYCRQTEFEELKKLVISLLEQAVISFSEEDLKIAEYNYLKESRVMDINLKIKSFFLEEMKSNSHIAETCYAYIDVAQNFTQIAKISTVLCKNNIYMITGYSPNPVYKENFKEKFKEEVKKEDEEKNISNKTSIVESYV